MNELSKNNRKIYMDVLRIVAAFFVIFNHTGDKGFFLFSVTDNPFEYWLYLFLSILCKIAVPLFFMISGALLLSKNEPLYKLYYKRVLKYIVIILVFSFFWYIVLNSEDLTNFSITTFLTIVYSSSITIPYWFLYSYLAAVLMLPFIRKMVQGLYKTEFIYMLVLFVVFTGVLPILQFFLFDDTVRINLSIPLVTTSSIFYMSMGYFVEQFDIKKVSTKYFVYMIILSLIGISLSCIMTWYKIRITGISDEASTQIFHNSFIALPAITIYCLAKRLLVDADLPAIVYKIIVSVSKCTFGIYLLEQFIREKMCFVYYRLFPYLQPLVCCLIFIVVVMAVGYFITLLLCKVPYIKKIFSVLLGVGV